MPDASNPQEGRPKPLKNEEKGMVIDPICLSEIDEEEAPAKSVYKGQTFYFCAERCKQMFEEDPEKYVDVKGEK
jgi:YHS domain-containing protein